MFSTTSTIFGAGVDDESDIVIMMKITLFLWYMKIRSIYVSAFVCTIPVKNLCLHSQRFDNLIHGASLPVKI